MNRISIFIILALLSLGVIVGCSILKGNDAEVKVKNFLSRFAADLQQSDSLAAEHFKTDHSSWALRSALKVLRNSVESPVTVNTLFPQAVVTINDSIVVSIPVTMMADSVGVSAQRMANLEMTLLQQDTTFVITRWNGEAFYQDYWSFSNAITAGENAHKISESRGHFYERALQLQETYDSVIWFANTGHVQYYYVVKGQWEYPYDEKLKTENYRMGLVDEKGNQIVPLEFDLIGMPGELLHPDLIEVKNADKVGCYELSTTKQLIPVEYDWIIPYEGMLLVKQDSVIGWYDPDFTFHVGYPDIDAEAFIRGFKFLPKQIRLNNTDASYLEIPSELYASVGYSIPANYYSYFGIFREIEGGYEGEIFNEQADVEYKEAKLSFFEKITDTFNALITEARDAYVYSREGFYDHQKVTFINSKGEFIKTHDLSKGKLAFRMIDDTHLEVKVSPSEGDTDDYIEADESEINTPRYVYFAAEGDQALTPLETNRWHACTAFAKLDSSYVTGDFTVYNEDGTSTKTTFLSTTTLTSMRNEILAEYGYTFQDPDVLQNYKYRDWYKPQYATVADFEGELSEIDRHNLAFLEKILGPVDTSTTAM